MKIRLETQTGALLRGAELRIDQESAPRAISYRGAVFLPAGEVGNVYSGVTKLYRAADVLVLEEHLAVAA